MECERGGRRKKGGEVRTDKFMIGSKVNTVQARRSRSEPSRGLDPAFLMTSFHMGRSPHSRARSSKREPCGVSS